MGFVIFGLLILYLIISIIVVAITALMAHKGGKSVLLWMIGSALVMYLIPFWDWIPTVVVHKYHCSSEAGFWVYKTPEQWQAENPGVSESLIYHRISPSKGEGDMNNSTTTYFLNQRFISVVKRNGKFFPNWWRYEHEIIDTKTNEVLARCVDFSTSQERREAGLSGWKFWLDNANCDGGRISFGKMLQFFGIVKKLGSESKK